MRGVIVAVLMVGTMMNTGTADAKVVPLAHACRFQYEDGRAHWNVAEVQHTIRCAVNRWPVPGGLTKAYYIANRESNFQQFAYNPSGCSGVYQWARGTWANVIRMFPGLDEHSSDSVWNARSNVMYAIRYAHGLGWGPWGG